MKTKGILGLIGLLYFSQIAYFAYSLRLWIGNGFIKCLPHLPISLIGISVFLYIYYYVYAESEDRDK